MSKVEDKNDSFCIMPWVHFHVSHNGNVIPCCQAPPHKIHRFGNINEQSISEIWQGEGIREFRKKMLEGVKDVRCKQCYLKEEQGLKSMRQVTNDKYSHVTVNSTSANPPVYFDLRFSNSCNLKCRICGPWASSQWHKDAVALGMKKPDSKALTVSIKNEEEFFNKLNPLLKEATEFYFAGGEPLMMEQHYKVLDALLEVGNTDIQLAYNTNFSSLTYKQYYLPDYWSKFKNVSLSASLDAEGEKGELLRKNLKWNNVIKNREFLLKELPHIDFQVAPTVCVFNVSSLPDFHKNWVEKKLIGVEDFLLNILVHPKEYQVQVLPLQEQLALKEKYEEHIEWMKRQAIKNKEKFDVSLALFESLIQQLGIKSQTELVLVLKDKVNQLDELRKEETGEIFSEMGFLKK